MIDIKTSLIEQIKKTQSEILIISPHHERDAINELMNACPNWIIVERALVMAASENSSYRSSLRRVKDIVANLGWYHYHIRSEFKIFGSPGMRFGEAVPFLSATLGDDIRILALVNSKMEDLQSALSLEGETICLMNVSV